MAQAPQWVSHYAFAQATGGDAERERLALLQTMRDAHTIRCLQAVGVGEGWRCLDVGAGGGSIAHWLSEQVSPRGSVVATDLETDALAHLNAANVEVIRHDILTEELPRDAFDLVHTRFLLCHLPQRNKALARIVTTTRPGGWVVVGDQDLRAVASAKPSKVFTRVWGAFIATVTSAGADIGYGAHIPTALEGQGLQDVQANGESLYWRGGSSESQLYVRAVERLRAEILASGLVSDSDLNDFSALLADPTFAGWSGTAWTGWGRKRAQ
jgi:SAM-dependent methyltransferase